MRTLPLVVGDLVDLERGVEAEADHLGVFGRGEGQGGLGGEAMRGGVDFGVDDVAGDVERGALGRVRWAARLKRPQRE